MVIAIPDTPAGMQLGWLLGLLNGPPEAITTAEVRPHFAASFLLQVPAGTVVALLSQFARDQAPLSVVGLTETPTSVTAVVETRKQTRFRIALQVTTPPLISGLLFSGPAPDDDPAVKTWEQLGPRLSAVAPRVRAVIAELDGDRCRPVHALGADEAMPLGSAFKLYVLGALAEKIRRGEAGWDDLLAIADERKSLPSGVLQNRTAGETLSLRAFATNMISISDNTATDHLLHFVGRQAVETQQAAFGHGRPTLNIPFLTTRELFILKLGASDRERAAYVTAGPDERRRLLADDYATRPLPSLASAIAWEAPRAIADLEWFASPMDLCRAHRGLRAFGETVLSVLSMNPGLVVDKKMFPFVGFKGGSEPGVLVLSWLLRRADDRWFAVSIGFADEQKAIDPDGALYLSLATVQLTGRVP